jgi:predicted permease
MFDRLRVLLRALLRRRQVERELDEELRYHLDRLIDQNIEQGMSPRAARLAALRSFDGVELSKEECRDARGTRFLEETLQDVRYGVRTLRKSPGFTTVAIVSLMLGIGANTAIFQLIDAVRLRMLPVERPTELMEICVQDAGRRTGRFEGWHPSLTYPLWEKIRDEQEGFAGVLAYGNQSLNLAPSGELREARGLLVSGDYFNVLGIRPAAGRLIAPADDRLGANPSVAVLSHAFWEREYGAAASAIGRTIMLEGKPFEIVGVAAPGFFGLEPGRSFDVAIPIAAEPMLFGEETRLERRNAWWLTAMGRLRPGWTEERATEQLASISPGIFEATLPPMYNAEDRQHYLGFSLTAKPAGTGISDLREDYERPLWLLLAIAGLVLVIACANLANLLLARASTQEREIAVRLALGASRGRIARQLFTESLVLATVGAALGLVAARFLSSALVSFLDRQRTPLVIDLGLDWRVFGFTAGLAVVTCILFGVAPALRATRTTPGATLKTGGRGSTEGRDRLTLRRGLVATQVALSLVLVAGALLFARTLANLLTVDTGFRQTALAVLAVDMTRLDLPEERRTEYKRTLVERIRAVPGVAGAADVAIPPLGGGGWNDEIYMDGADPSTKALSFFNSVSPGYFATLGVPVVAGRDFDARDTRQSPAVAVVNEEFARRFAGGANPIGARFFVVGAPDEPARSYEIVGLVKDSKYRSLRETTASVAFLASAQEQKPDLFLQILVRSGGPLGDLLPALRQELASADPGLVFRCVVLESVVRDSLLRERLMATLTGFFGLLALALATVGLYGVTSYAVTRRTHEIGVRMALGAMRRNILAMVMREVAVLVAGGLAVGAVAAVMAAKAADALLFGVKPGDPVTLCAAVVLLAAVAAAAGLVPARRASSVDPMTALRDE